MKIQGIVRSIIFRNDENGYTVARFYVEEEAEEITIVGNILSIEEGMELELDGDWIYHPKYHEQFSFRLAKEHLPTEEEGILKYLSSGMIPYVGKKTAKKMVNLFGKETLQIIQFEPERLSEISGIGPKKIEKISEAFLEQREIREILVFTQAYDISTNDAIKIYKKFGKDSLKILQENPYQLAEEITGIGFAKADKMAKKLGIKSDNPLRKDAAISFILRKAISAGHCYLPTTVLWKEVAKLLKISEEDIVVEPEHLAISPKYFVLNRDGEFHIYFSNVYRAENYVAQNIYSRLHSGNVGSVIEVEREIQEIEESLGYDLAEKQREALKQSVNSSVFILTGGPGTGKTTTLKALILLFEAMDKKVALAAPTGRAAKRMEEATNRPASTIHRLLEFQYQEDDFFIEREVEKEIETDVLIIDEVSMVDLFLMDHVLQALSSEAILIMVGDKDQLPSVGAGNVLGDLISTGKVPVVELNEIFRQEATSFIVLNAHRINHGELPIVNQKGGDFFWMRESEASTGERMVQLISERLPDFYGLNPIDDIQVLTPMRKGAVGVERLNAMLQKALNPPDDSKEEVEIFGVVFRVGDKVMQVKNNYQLGWKSSSTIFQEEGEGIFNGDVGIIRSIDNDEKTVTIVYDDVKEVEYTFQGMEEVRLSYAMTIHKSQGSEYPIVILPIQWAPPMLLTKNLLYTGITRAKQVVVLIGQEKYLQMMVHNKTPNLRYTNLAYKLIEFEKRREVQSEQNEDEEVSQ